MTTRSGLQYKPTMSTDSHAEGTGSEQSQTPEDTLPEMSSLAGILRCMMEDRECQRAEDRHRYQEENERRAQEMQQHRELLQQRIISEGAASPRPSASAPRESDMLKLTRLTEGDDIEAYLTTFERMMRAYDIAKERWAFKLVPQLTGKAQQAYAALRPDAAQDYDELKAAILRRYDINEETCRRRFRGLQMKEGETPQELVTRLTDLATRWTRDASTRGELLDLVIKEQLLLTLPEEIRIWVSEHKPKSSQEAGELAANYLQARSTIGAKKAPKTDKLPTTKCPKCGLYGHWARDCPQPPQSRPKPGAPRQQKNRFWEGVTCFNCNEKGHIASKCPSKALYCAPQSPDLEPRRCQASRVRRQGTVNGVYCRDILLDTGSTKTLVRKELVAEQDMLGGETAVCCAHGDVVKYPTATIKVCIGGEDIQVQAGVSDTLPAAALLGWDVAQLMSLMSGKKDPEGALAVFTRSQKRIRDDPAETAAETEPSLAVEENNVFNLDASLFSPPGPLKSQLSRSQKRANSKQYLRSHAPDAERTQDNAISLTADGLRVLQQEDESLQKIRMITNEEDATNSDGRFFRRNGLIYRRYVSSGDMEAEEVEQLVLPKACRQAVIKLAHSIPLAEHLGKKKTLSRVQKRFYWPGIYHDVSTYCKSCEECQKTSPRDIKKTPLIPLPIMEEPFRRIAMDIVGPLPRSRSGKRFVLVVCDYATRYPEAVAMQTIDAHTLNFSSRRAGEVVCSSWYTRGNINRPRDQFYFAATERAV